MNDFAKLSKKDFLRYTGQLSQIAGITRFTYADGMARGIPAVQVRNGSGLAFTVLEGRNMDLYNLEYKGINLAFFYKNGLTAPERVSNNHNEFLGQSSGGMMYTSGLQNSGPANEAEGLYQPLHGRIGAKGAENISTKSYFDDSDNYCFEISGKTREARLFNHNLTLERTLSTEMNANSLKIIDIIENETCRDTFYSILYHINFGYPFLDEGTEIVVSDQTISTARTEWSKKYFDERFHMTKPIDNFAEHLYYHDLPANEQNLCSALIINNKLNLAVEITYDKASLPCLVEWKSMGSGDYALGILPSSTILRGRHDELEANGMSKLDSFAKTKTGFVFAVIEGAEAIALRTRQIRAI